jgi:hypothetical protein
MTASVILPISQTQAAVDQFAQIAADLGASGRDTTEG